MSEAEYKDAIICAAQISELRTISLNECEQELFEKYCTLQEEILKKELLG